MGNEAMHWSAEMYNGCPVTDFRTASQGFVVSSHWCHPWGSYCHLLPPRQIAKLLLGKRMVGRGGGDRTEHPSNWSCEKSTWEQQWWIRGDYIFGSNCYCRELTADSLFCKPKIQVLFSQLHCQWFQL